MHHFWLIALKSFQKDLSVTWMDKIHNFRYSPLCQCMSMCVCHICFDKIGVFPFMNLLLCCYGYLQPCSLFNNDIFVFSHSSGRRIWIVSCAILIEWHLRWFYRFLLLCVASLFFSLGRPSSKTGNFE